MRKEGKTKNRVSGEQAGGKLELEEVVAWRESGVGLKEEEGSLRRWADW